MTVELRAEPPFEDVLQVVRNMRAADRAEIYATLWEEDDEYFARIATLSGGFRWGAYYEGRPIAMIGATPRWPNVWDAWAFGTDEWPKAVRTLTKHVRRFMIPALQNAGAVRVDAHALASHNESNKWLTFLGADPGKPLANWGKNGETFVAYTWLR